MCARAAMALFRLHINGFRRRYEPGFMLGAETHRRYLPSEPKQRPISIQLGRQDQGLGRMRCQCGQPYCCCYSSAAPQHQNGSGLLPFQPYQQNLPDRRSMSEQLSQSDASSSDRHEQAPSIRKSGRYAGLKKRVRWGLNTFVN